MKLKIKLLAAAATMAVAGQASAALTDTFVTDGTLFLTVYDTLTNNSYTRDLGVSLSGFLPTGSLVANAGTTLGPSSYNFAGTTNFTTLFAGASAANIRWAITGVDNIESDGNGSRFVSTYGIGAAPALTNGAVRNVASNAVLFAGELLANSGVDYTGAAVDGAFPAQATASYGGKSFNSVLDGTGGIGQFQTGFGSAAFYYAGTTNSTNIDNAGVVTPTQFGNSSNFATFTLDTSGNLTYALAPAVVSAVPIPAAAWLLGSGLMGLGGMARRRMKGTQAA